jgi:hypothetical protein
LKAASVADGAKAGIGARTIEVSLAKVLGRSTAQRAPRLPTGPKTMKTMTVAVTTRTRCPETMTDYYDRRARRR